MIPYIGGKSMLSKWIISHFPEHKCYVEVFGGAGWVLSNKEHSKSEVYNDINSSLVNLFEILKSKEKSKELSRRAKWMMTSREQFYHSRDVWQNNKWSDEIDHALCFAHYMCCGRLGKMRGMSFKINKTGNGTATASWIAFCKRIITARNRLKTVVIEKLDYTSLIEKYDSPSTLFYLDPPYLKSDYYYCVNWKMDDHIKLAKVLSAIKGKFVLSYYDSEIIRALYPSCCFSVKDTRIYAYHDKDNPNNNKPTAQELLVMNFKPSEYRQLELIDFLGTEKR